MKNPRRSARKDFSYYPKGSEHSMSGPAEGTWIRGSRLEAAVSPSRNFADIIDGKTLKKLTMLDKEALVELRDLSQELIDFMGGE